MRVEELMIRDIASCAPSTDLAAIAVMMWNKDCGVVPVTDGEGKPVGMITDRDISIAGATQRRPLSDISVSDVKDGRIITCKAEQDVKEALRLMASAKVRRLPVVDGNGTLIGILSMGDIVASVSTGRNGVSSQDGINALKSIYVHH